MSPGAPTQLSTVDRATRTSTGRCHAERYWLITLSVPFVMATAAAARAQTTGQIYGRVVEAKSERPVSGAAIEIAVLQISRLTSGRSFLA